MDGASVRMLLQSIVDDDSNKFDASERREAVRWLHQRIWLPNRSKGSSGPEHQPHIEIATQAADLAVKYYERGDHANAKQQATKALKSLSGG